MNEPFAEPADVAASASRSRLDGLPGTIGPFRILRRIGEGGMGVVFLAREDRPPRDVALKIIHAAALSETTLRRFQLETETLGRLQHPGIAQIYQVGTYAAPSGALPYFAMEYVEGQRLDVYARERTPSIRVRLELAARIADAVDHAHQKGVIHRDLKPGNILVTAEGQPKILDFGVARVADAEGVTTTLRTDVGALLGTLPYMSPEQASGDPRALDARSDVYSLGVVIFELLTGRLPYLVDRRFLPEAVRVIREEEPSKLSTHDRTLRGDVETIVHKALEKDPARRYASAAALAADLRRYLADEPITARRPSAAYQLSKFARRNKALVGGVIAVLLALAAGTAVATTQAVRARTAERLAVERLERAEIEERKAQQVAGFLQSLLQGVEPVVAQGADTTLMQRILAQAEERLSSELADQPEVLAEIHRTLGKVYVALSLYRQSEAHLRAAEGILLELVGPEDDRTLDVQATLAAALIRSGEHARAEELQRATLERREASAPAEAGKSDVETLEAKGDLADNLMRQGRTYEAEELLRSVLAEQRERLGEEHDSTLETKITLAQTIVHTSAKGPEEAQGLVEDVLFVRSETLGDDHPQTIIALETLGQVLATRGQYAEAEDAHREALERARRVYGIAHQHTYTIINNLAVCVGSSGRLVEAEALLRECLDGRRRLLGEESLDALTTIGHLGDNLYDQGRIDEAETLFREAYESLRRVMGDDHRETMLVCFSLAVLSKERMQYAAAAEYLERIADHNRRVLDERNTDRPLSLYNWAGTLQDADDYDASEAPLREALEIVARHGMENEAFVPATKNALAKVLERQGKHEEADELYRDALETRRRWYGGVHSEITYSLSNYGEALLERGDLEAAEPLLEENHRVQSALSSEDDWELASARALYGRCLALEGRYAEGEQLLLRSCETLERVPAPRDLKERFDGWLVALYESWEAAEPGQGQLERAARWRKADE